MKKFLIGIFSLAILSVVSNAEEVVVKRRVVLPNGAPAQGANVLVRRVGADKQWRDERLKTDGEGVFAAVVEKETESNFHWPTDFALIDMPGYAIGMDQLIGETRGEPPKVKLSPQFLVRGQIVDGDGKPVSNAEVSVVTVSTWMGNRSADLPLRAPGERHSPRELTTWSDAAGNFVLRAVASGREWGAGESMVFVATATHSGNFLLGYRMGGIPRVRVQSDMGQAAIRFSPKPLVITLQPTHTVSGRAVDGVTGKPLAGVRVRLQALTPLPMPKPIVTGDDGFFHFTQVPPGAPISVLARRLNFADARISLFDNNDHLAPAKSFSDLVFQMHPLVQVHVTLVDADTGKPPVIPLGLFAALIDGKSLLGVEGEQEGFFSRKDNASSLIDGTFSMPIAVGANSISPAGSGREEDAYQIVKPEKSENRMCLIIGGQEGQNVQIKVRRVPGLILKIETPDAALLANTILYIRTQHDAEEILSARSGYVFRYGYKLGDKITVRAMCDKQEVLPPTEIEVDPGNAPFVIRLPR